MEKGLRNMQGRLLEMLREFDEFCRENGLQYFLVGGSVLGACRHKGFIPWDDDIDLAMMRSDFERMEMLMAEKKKNRLDTVLYSPVDHHVLPDAPIGYLLDESAKERGYQNAAKIDIHPIDGVPEDMRIGRLQNILSKVYYLMVYGLPTKNKGKAMRMVTRVILFLTPERLRKIYCRKLKKFLTQWDDRESAKVCSLFGLAGYRREVMPGGYLFPLREMEFEGHRFPAPGKTDLYLKRLYGNYETLPPEEERKPKHDTFRYYE